MLFQPLNPTTNLGNIFKPETTLELMFLHPHSADEEIEVESGKKELPKIT